MHGCITYKDKHEISIGAGANAECTFWHEVLHGIDWVYNNGCTNEKSIERLAQGIYQVTKEMDMACKKCGKKKCGCKKGK